MHKVIRARNVQDAYLQGMRYLRQRGELSHSRNGTVYVAPGPVMTEYARPMERVILDPGRDANPFFHLMEAFWMLAGRDDVKSISYYNSRMASYSDDGFSFNAAYGHRWRKRFGFDQVVRAIEQLRRDWLSRRVVIQIWDGRDDGQGESLDFPCNTVLYFRARRGEGWPWPTLDMTISNRSNDIVWGAYGANAVHMSVLHEFIAACAGMTVGKMYQLSNNYHGYADIMNKVGDPQKKHARAYAGMGGVKSTPLFNVHCKMLVGDTLLRHIEAWWDYPADKDVLYVLEQYMTADGFQTLTTMRAAWDMFKLKQRDGALELCSRIPGEDWARACCEWLDRRRPAIVGSQNG